MPTYSFGVNSVLKIEITEEQATRFNRFTKAFFDAQKFYKDMTGFQWNPEDALYIKAADGDMEVYNEVADILTSAIEKIDQTVTPIELEEDFLIKN
jgi:hypothetical protein